MHQFQVPQFITIEDKVIGPFTIKQFLYLAGGGLIILGARAIFNAIIVIPIAIIIGGLALAFAFLKINEVPFPTIAKNAVFYALRPRFYIWKQMPQSPQPQAPEAVKKIEPTIKTIPKMSDSKLSDLAWSLDIKEKVQEETEKEIK